MSSNPFLAPYDTPFAAPPFAAIQEAHYLPAFEAAMVQQQQQVEAIVGNEDEPTFANTLEALEVSGEVMARVSSVFSCVLSADTNDEMQDIAREISPRLSRHRDDILLNSELFRRLDTVYQQRDALDLDVEARALLKHTHQLFRRGGAQLGDAEQAELRKLNEELVVLTLAFRDNLLAETNAFELVLASEDELAGIPDPLRRAAAETATQRGHEGKWVFTLHGPSFVPFLQYAERRDLRQQIYQAYISRCDHGNEYDNNHNASRIASLRARRAQLMGYATHAHYVLEDCMAETPQRVYDLLDDLWPKALQRSQHEIDQMQRLIDREEGGFELAAWDWWFYAEKVRKEQFDLDDALLQPYFSLDRVRDGAFEVARRLFGITFEPRDEVPVYHPDVEVFEVKDGDGTHLGLFYTDFSARDSKRVGAWMNAFRKQRRQGGDDIRPLISNVCNFPRREGDQPVLLRFEEVNTLFHEFGHALHGLLSQCRYESLSGTSVPRDFVELPSQIMENWAFEPEVMAIYARHYETDEVIPQDLVEKIKRSAQFNQGFVTTEYLAASFLDMDWHTLEKDEEITPDLMEQRTTERLGLPPQIAYRYRSPYFGHIFTTGYAAGYYSYIWAAVLDADGFEAFREQGDLFDPQVAKAWRRNVLERGKTEPSMDLYRRFRGREPRIEPLLERRGLV